MNSDIVGRGWAFPPQIDAQGKVALASDFAEIEQAIRIILGTAIGERVMRPTFGSRLFELVFASINAETMALARHYVEDALAMWEPRINIVDITVHDPFQGSSNYHHELGCLSISIQYEIKASGDQRSLVYPFYLIPED